MSGTWRLLDIVENEWITPEFHDECVASRFARRWQKYDAERYLLVEVTAPHGIEAVTASLLDASALAIALHAYDSRDELARIATDARRDESKDAAQHRMHLARWDRLPSSEREAYSRKAVDLLAWIKGAE